MKKWFMLLTDCQYWLRRAIEADRLSEVSVNPGVKAVHASFAVSYRDRAALESNNGALSENVGEAKLVNTGL